ncbi:DUF2220 family protein [Anoxybacillus rupiensis]|jgi:hypothetical protein|uniref:DUF2220 family protein n=1 Tax=Anoxybacteroides rupiense TaxID=311460 RepID=A0ABT5W8C6_9BACL|nr:MULTISPECIES: Wadjet anti-phage system protein JetD domain-containing protein [Anoxybacillus]MDE8565583.1 DUF2220 family protein [Anoxybacillus rupiensis]QHC03335.1 DUF2399 domain-containing protein [Anoxybacillus sp. PDR2]
MENRVTNEIEYKNHFQQELLKLLIQKYENSKAFATGEPSKQRPQIAIEKSPFHKDYNDEMDFRKKEWIHDVVIKLSREGIITHTWEKFGEGRQLAKLFLEFDKLQVAYELAGVTPRDVKMTRLRGVLMPLLRHPWPWVVAWASSAVQALSERRTVGLDLDDKPGYEQLVVVLSELPKLEDNVPKRVLSQRLFQDTKLFERSVERRLVQLIHAHADIEFESDAEALESVGIAAHPRNVFVAGPLAFRTGEGGEVSLKVFRGGVGLSHATVWALEPVPSDVKRIILIENLTSWHQWVADREGEDEIVVYTGGFPNRTVQLLLKKIAGLAKAYHWGDIDVGGIRIFEFIRENFIHDLQPIGMDVAVFLEYAKKGMELGRGYERKVEAMLKDGQFSRWHDLLRLMLAHGKRIEQESVDKLPLPDSKL